MSVSERPAHGLPAQGLQQDLLLFASRQTAVLAARIAQALGMALTPCEEREFEGGEHKMRPSVPVRGRDVFVIQSLCGDSQASVNDKLCRLLFFINTLKDAGAARVSTCVPYLCYARKDRRTQAHDPVTLRYVAALFEAVGVDRVIVLDVHNEAAFDNAFRCQTLRVEASSTFADHLTQRNDTGWVVVSPDIGGIKRAQMVRELLVGRFGHEVDFAFMEKRRARGVVSGELLVGEVTGRDVLIVDDMIASGSTIMRATAAARRAGARSIRVAATHATFMESALQLFTAEGPDSVLVTDSVILPAAFAAPLAQHRLEICSVAPLLARTIAELAS